jgi:hypothetical protein
MKTSTATSRPCFLALLALTSALAIAALGPTRAADSTGGKPMMHANMMAGCGEMMEQKQATMTTMQAQDTALTALVAAMNAAPAGKKSELMAVIVTSLVEQRAAQNEQTGKMQGKMMAHLMGHMEMGQDSMSSCPMMKGMGDKSMQAHQEPKGDKQ